MVEKSAQKKDKLKTPAYFVWNGSDFLTFPRTLSLPMITAPNDSARGDTTALIMGVIY